MFNNFLPFYRITSSISNSIRVFLRRPIDKISSSINNKVRNFFRRPSSLKEYYTLGKLMISKKLVYIIFLLLSILSAVYLIMILPESIMEYYYSRSGNKIYTKYNTSRSLKNYNGVARVVSKKSDAQYIGDIVNGLSSGRGTLYDKRGNILYEGDFLKNEYSGNGTLYYIDGSIQYIGGFRNNNFYGQGKLYRESHKLEYEGNFVNGVKSGDGILYNFEGVEIFKGAFLDDSPSLEKYLDGKASLLNENFLEKGLVYSCSSQTGIVYKNLGVLVVLNKQENYLDEEGVISKIYVLNNKYFSDVPKLERNELDKKMDEKKIIKSYAGYTKVYFPEMSAIDYLKIIDKSISTNFSNYIFDKEYSDVLVSSSYKSNDNIYTQSYNVDNIGYTFYFKDKYSPYIFYSIERLS